MTPPDASSKIQFTSLPGRVWDAVGRDTALTDILAQVSREALQGEGLDEVLQGIVDCLVRRLSVSIVSIMLLDDDGAQFVQEVWAGELDLDQSFALPWPVTRGAAGRCVRSGEPQLINNLEQDRDYVPGHHAVRSEYLVPIRHRSRMHGVLNIESSHTNFFTAEACALFDAVADQIAGAIHLARVAAELEAANRKLEQLSMSDGLTGIANRRCFDMRLAKEWDRMARKSRMLALALVDADHFKLLNDAYGHLYGDECLRELARVCSEVVKRKEDLVARYGGEELVLLMPGRDLQTAHSLCEQLRQRFQAEAIAHPQSPIAPHATVSIGVCAVRPDYLHLPEQLFLAADRALYAAKAMGRNRVVSRSFVIDG